MSKRALVLLGMIAGCSTPNPDFDGADGSTSSADTWGGSTRGSTSPSTSGSGTASTATTESATTGSATTGATSSEDEGTSWGTSWGTSRGTTWRDDDDDDRGEGTSAFTETWTTRSTETRGETTEDTATETEEMSSSSDGTDTAGESTTGCATQRWYLDRDEDTFGGEFVEESCEPPTSGSGPYATRGGDCDDDDAEVRPGALELCRDEIDNDCVGGIDDAPECELCRPVDAEGLWLCEDRSWDEASQLCTRFESRLVVADSEMRELELAQVLESEGVEAAWIGLSRGAQQPFRWVTGVGLDYVNWLGAGEPEPGPRLCVTLGAGSEGLGWVVQPCASPQPALCEES